MSPYGDTNGAELVDYDSNPVSRSLPAILTCLALALICIAGGVVMSSS